MPQWNTDAKLLRGGKFVLFSSRVLHCWQVDEDILLWTHCSSVPHANVLAFAAEVVDGKRAIIIVCIASPGRRSVQTFSPQPRFDIVFPNVDSFVEIVSVDLETGMSDLILTAERINCSWATASPRPKVCGDIAAVRFSQLRPSDTFFTQLYLVINWRTQSSFTIVCSPVSKCFFYLPRHRLKRAFITRNLCS